MFRIYYQDCYIKENNILILNTVIEAIPVKILMKVRFIKILELISVSVNFEHIILYPVSIYWFGICGFL